MASSRLSARLSGFATVAALRIPKPGAQPVQQLATRHPDTWGSACLARSVRIAIRVHSLTLWPRRQARTALLCLPCPCQWIWMIWMPTKVAPSGGPPRAANCLSNALCGFGRHNGQMGEDLSGRRSARKSLRGTWTAQAQGLAAITRHCQLASGAPFVAALLGKQMRQARLAQLLALATRVFRGASSTALSSVALFVALAHARALSSSANLMHRLNLLMEVVFPVAM